jgi:hypothetical protein
MVVGVFGIAVKQLQPDMNDAWKLPFVSTKSGSKIYSEFEAILCPYLQHRMWGNEITVICA